MTDRNRMRSRTRGPCARVLLLGLAGAALALSAAAGEARIERASGEVEVGRGAPAVWEAAAVGASLSPGDAVRTGRDGRAELRWRAATIRLYGDSLLRLPPERAEGGAVELDAGSGLFDVEHREGRSFEVHTPEVVVSVKGTRFAVTLGGGPAEVAVFRGVVGVRARALALEREVLVREGFRALGGAGRPAELFLLERRDPWPDFGPRATPPSARPAEAPPAKRALDDARHAGREAIRVRALKLALERDPGLLDRLSRAEERHRDRRRGAGERGEDPRADRPLERLEDARLANADPISDARLARLGRLLESKYVRAWLNHDTIDGSGGGGLFELEVDGGTATVSTADRTWQLDEDALMGVLEGTQTLPADLEQALQDSGIDSDAELAAMLLMTLR